MDIDHLIKNRYEVHTWTLCDGWVNCWTVTDDNGIEQTDGYPTINAAQLEIDEIFADMEAEIKAGDRALDESYDRDDYRIYEAQKKEYVG